MNGTEVEYFNPALSVFALAVINKKSKYIKYLTVSDDDINVNEIIHFYEREKQNGEEAI